MDEKNIAEFHEKLISEVVDVFERNEAGMFDMYRVLNLMADSTKQYMLDSLGDMQGQLRKLLEALEDIEGGGEVEGESEG